MLAFSPDAKMIPAIFFSVSKAFLKEYPVILILIPEVWTEEMKLLLHISYSTKLWFIPFLARIRTGQKHADPDPKHIWKFHIFGTPRT